MAVGQAMNATEPSTTMTNVKKPGTAWWRPLVDGIDSRVTPPANKLVRTNAFADTASAVTRLEAGLRRRVERQSSSLLHAFNLPTAVDVRKLRTQLAAVEARLRDMGERLEDEQEAAARARRDANPPTGSRAKTRTGSTG
jgi:hypothetical protein